MAAVEWGAKSGSVISEEDYVLWVQEQSAKEHRKLHCLPCPYKQPKARVTHGIYRKECGTVERARYVEVES